MLRAKIFVQLKPSVLDPQGKAVTNSLKSLGFEQVTQTRISKFIEVTLDMDDLSEGKKVTEEICQQLLANPNTESYHFELEEIAP